MCSNVQVQHSLFTDVTETIALFAPSPDSSLMGKGKKYPTNPEGDLYSAAKFVLQFVQLVNRFKKRLLKHMHLSATPPFK